MKKNNKKYFKVMAGFMAGVALLTCGVFANYENAGGYSVCKNALKKIIYAEDYSIDYSIEASIDNESLVGITGYHKLNLDGNPTKGTEAKVTYKGEMIDYNKFTRQDRDSVYEFLNGDGQIRGYLVDTSEDATTIVDAISPESGDRFVFFGETICDAMIGDLKNSFVLTADEEGVRTYNVSLTKEQMPSYIGAGVALLTSVVKENIDIAEAATEYEPFRMLLGSGEPYVKDVALEMSVDKEGNPKEVKGVANVAGYDADGNEHILTIKMEMKGYDFGSTELKYYSKEDIAAFGSYEFISKEEYEYQETAIEEEIIE